MNVQLTREELDLVIRALQELKISFDSKGMTSDQVGQLVKKLEQQAATEQSRGSGDSPANPTQGTTPRGS